MKTSSKSDNLLKLRKFIACVCVCFASIDAEEILHYFNYSLSLLHPTVPKVSIDGRSHGDMLLVAIGSGTLFAIIILIVLISLIRHKKKAPKIENIKDAMKVEKVIETPSGNFTLTSSTNSYDSTPSRSNLMFKYFGKSLSSFDVERSYMNSKCIAINIENDFGQSYKKQVLSPVDIVECCKEKCNQIQTISC